MATVCKGHKKDGKPCSSKTKNANGYCGRHQAQATSAPVKSNSKRSTSPSKKSSSRESDLPTCSGTTSSGKPCRMKTSRASGLCRYHDPNYDPNESKAGYLDGVTRTMLQKIKANLEDRYQMTFTMEATKGEMTEEEARQVVQSAVNSTIAKATELDKGTYAYLRGKDEPQLPRKAWWLVAQFLEDDWRGYDALALTCTKLHTLMCKDKVWHANHPLKGKWWTPSRYRMPIYRVISIDLPDQMTTFFKQYNLPSLQAVLAEHEKTNGKISTALERDSHEASILTFMMQEVISQIVKNQNIQLEGVVPGTGIFSDPPERYKPSFHSKKKHIVAKNGRETYIILPLPNMRGDMKTTVEFNYQLKKRHDDCLVRTISL